jgi:hypothetical protein
MERFLARGLIGPGLILAACAVTAGCQSCQREMAEPSACYVQAPPMVAPPPPTVRAAPPALAVNPVIPPPPMVPPPMAPVMVPPSPSPSVPPARAKLTVVNVRQEAALLFLVNAEGELTFVEKLAPGSVIDLDTKTGTRWAAVFSEKPSSQSFRVATGEAVWLLRAPAARPVSPQTPVAPVVPSAASY